MEDGKRVSESASAGPGQAMVATGHPLAAHAAAEVLREGGTAVDAAIAADAVMGVVEPMATGIGGDLMAMLIPPDGPPRAYNGSGRAPAALRPDNVAQLPGQRIPERHPLSVTTPGAVRGWHDLHRRHGRLPWRRLLQPSSEMAAAGFAVAPVAAREWAWFEPVLRLQAECAALYRAGAVPRAGETFRNPELAAVLESIASDGPDAFYRGVPARAAEEAVRPMGGVLAAADFAAHRGEFVSPLKGSFRGLDILQCPPNTHGLAVLQALAELEPLPLPAEDPATVLAAVQAMERAQEHAKRTVADPAGNTVCTVVVDAEGFAVTLMSSIFKRFGSGIAVPGCGFVLQNRGFGFSRPGHLNGPAPGRRPFHTVVPGAALRNGRFHAAFGVVGGAMQPQGQVQILMRVAAWGQDPQSAIDAPRWRLEGGQLAIEAGMPEPICTALRAAGYEAPATGELGSRSDFGGAQFVMRTADGGLAGGSDRRKDGLALASLT